MTLTVYFLQASRAIRTVWLVEELGIKDYELKCANRVNGRAAPDDFKKECGNPLGKFPTIRDGDLVIYESGAITEYLCEKYDKDHRLIPAKQPERSKVQMWIHASEATLMLHALPTLYAEWSIPSTVTQDDKAKLLEGLSVNIGKDLDWVEVELEGSSGKFLCGDHVTAADIMMHMALEFILTKQIGTRGKKYPRIAQWVKDCEATPSFKRAAEKSGHDMSVHGKA